MNSGWVKIHRSILDWQWWPDDHMLRLWMYLILTASVEDRTWRDVPVKRGQVVTTIPELAEKTGMSYKNVRTCLARLTESGEIGRQTTNKYSIITICKFNSYQFIEDGKGQTKGRQRADKGQTKQRFSPHTPLSKEHKNERKSYYSSTAHECAREDGEQEKQFFFIFYLKGSSDPSSECENFISWNMTPSRVEAWDRCPERAKYATAWRWNVKATTPQYSRKAGEIMKALVDVFIGSCPDFMKGFYDSRRYPCELSDDGTELTLNCDAATKEILDGNASKSKAVLRRFGIKKLYYRIRP